MENELTLKEAAEAISQLTPEDFIAMKRYEAASEMQLPEAPVSINFRASSQKGYDFLITMRDWDEERLLKRLGNFAKRLDEELSISPNKSATSNVTPESTGEIRITSDVDTSVIEGNNVDMYEVSSIVHLIGKKGSYFKIKGGKYKQWGWNAFQEVFPPDVKMPVMAKDEETTKIPRELQYAYVDIDQKRIVAFAQSV